LKPARTSEHGARIAERRERLRSKLLEILPPSRPFVWEVGCGHGHFLAAYAAAHPQEPCVGIDISSDRVSRANRKRERARLANLHFILAEADDFLGVMPEAARFSSIYVLFPDPWPKRRHHKNRVLTPGFLTAVAAAAGKGAPLFFRTDHEGYFRDAEAAVRTHSQWRISDATLLPLEEPTVFQKRADRHFTLVALKG
jgi:tRNA (guanine-N7-)-methyltransferase